MLTLTASGSVSDYSDNVTSSLQQKVATTAGVNKSLVTIDVAAASVRITATIAVPASPTADAVQTSLSAAFGTANAASTALGFTVEEVPIITVEVKGEDEPLILSDYFARAIYCVFPDGDDVDEDAKHRFPLVFGIFICIYVLTLASPLACGVMMRRWRRHRLDSATRGGALDLETGYLQAHNLQTCATKPMAGASQRPQMDSKEESFKAASVSGAGKVACGRKQVSAKLGRKKDSSSKPSSQSGTASAELGVANTPRRAKSKALKPTAKVTGKLAAAEKAVVKKVAPACSLHNHQFPPP